MAEHDRMRASDADRQAVITYLRTALDEGRLKMDEYLDRMGHASGASRPTSPAARAIDLRPARDHHTDPSATCNPEITLSHYFRVGPGGGRITDMSSMPPQCIQPSLVRQ